MRGYVTYRGFRAGAAITLVLSERQLADIMSHVGWRTNPTALYYVKLAQVLRPGRLEHLPTFNTSLEEAMASYTALNNLEIFI